MYVFNHGKMLRKYDCEIMPECLLPYTSELNPVAIRYSEVKRRVFARREARLVKLSQYLMG